MDQTFTINLLSYTKTLVPIYRFRAITFFMVPPFWGKKWPSFSRSLNCGYSIIVATPFLDMCLDIFGAWINPKISFNWDINLENIALFANTVFLNIKSWSWIMLGVVMNVLCFVLMVCWNQHMASIEMYIFSVDVVLITCWNIPMALLFWVGMHQRSLSIPASGATHI